MPDVEFVLRTQFRKANPPGDIALRSAALRRGDTPSQFAAEKKKFANHRLD
jgi:hypothetical protein